MYETGTQENCNPKRIVLRDPRCQRCRNAARCMALHRMPWLYLLRSPLSSYWMLNMASTET